jgi:hypothetical protein
MILLGDRNFFSMNRWRTASASGADLAWRVKKGAKSLPVDHTRSQPLPDGSLLVVLRESNGMLSARREAIGDRRAPRLEQITARLIEFTVTVTDQAGRSTRTRFRVLTTLLDPATAPAHQIAECYAHRWEAETTYRMIKTVLRGPGWRLRGQSPDLAEQELWGLLAVHNALVDQAVAAAIDLGIDARGVIALLLLAGLVQDRDHAHAVRAGAVGDGQVFDHEVPHDAHRGAGLPGGVVEQPLHLVRGTVPARIQPFLRGRSLTSPVTYLRACRRGSRRTNTCPIRPSSSSRRSAASSAAPTISAAAVSYSS